ncbi:peptidoglycan-recognition protein LC-like isoform X2 [Hetaerina americana]
MIQDTDEALLCSVFGMKINPNLSYNTAEHRLTAKANPTSALWMVFTDNLPQIKIIMKWVAILLCLSAVISFAIVLKIITKRERSQCHSIKKCNIELGTSMINKSQLSGYQKMEPQISFISKDGSDSGTKPSVSSQKLSICGIWPAFASMFVYVVALVGFLFLSYHFDVREDGLLRKCVTLDIPLAVTPSEGVTDGLELDQEIFPIISREEWMMKPLGDAKPLKLPVKQVTMVSTSSGSCSSQEDCIAEIRRLQEYDLGPEDGLWDTSFNFLVARDGRIYEGRGWNTTARIADLDDDSSIFVLFTGVSLQPLSPTQLSAFITLINEGVQLGNIAEGYDLAVNLEN